jgi:hypothetical protein
LPRAIPIVKEVLGIGIVYRYDREKQDPFFGHTLEPNNTRCRFLGPSDNCVYQILSLRMNAANEIGSVIHCDVRFHVEASVYVFVIGLGVFPFD